MSNIEFRTPNFEWAVFSSCINPKRSHYLSSSITLNLKPETSNQNKGPAVVYHKGHISYSCKPKSYLTSQEILLSEIKVRQNQQRLYLECSSGLIRLAFGRIKHLSENDETFSTLGICEDGECRNFEHRTPNGLYSYHASILNELHSLSSSLTLNLNAKLQTTTVILRMLKWID
jgi:hypothetical protein